MYGWIVSDGPVIHQTRDQAPSPKHTGAPVAELLSMNLPEADRYFKELRVGFSHLVGNNLFDAE